MNQIFNYSEGCVDEFNNSDAVQARREMGASAPPLPHRLQRSAFLLTNDLVGLS